MGKKKGFFNKLGKIITEPVKFIGKLPRETCRILDQALDIDDKAIKKQA